MVSPEPLYGYGVGVKAQIQVFLTSQSQQEQQHPYEVPSYTSPPTEPYDTGEFEVVTTPRNWWGWPSPSESPGQFPGQDSGQFHGFDSLDGQMDTESGSDPWAWTWDRTVKAIVLSPIVIFTIIGNFLVLYAFLAKKRDLRSPTHFFIANLSLADFLVGFLAMPFLATLHTTDRWYFGPNFCYAWVIIHFWLCSASILSTLAVCMERYIGVKYPLRHIEIMSPNRVIGTILGVWGLAGFLSLISVLAFPEPDAGVGVGRFGCRLNNQLGHVLIATIGILYIPAGLMIFLYWRIYLIASTHLEGMKGRRAGGQGGRGQVQGKVTEGKSPTEKSRPRSKTKTWSKLNLFRFSGTPTTSEHDDSNETQAHQNGVSGDHYYSTGESGFSSFSSSSSAEPPPQGVGVSEVKVNDNAKVKVVGFETKTATNNNNAPSSSPTIITITPTQSVTSLDLSRKQINLAKRLAFLVGILLLSYIPFFTAFLIRAVAPGAVPDLPFTILGWIRYSNSALNPIIYAWAVPSYRKAFQNILLGFRNKK